MINNVQIRLLSQNPNSYAAIVCSTQSHSASAADLLLVITTVSHRSMLSSL